MPITTNTKNTVLKGLVGQTSIFATSVYLGLSSTAPTNTGGNITEPVGNGYERVLIGAYNQSLTQLFGTPANGEVTNKDIIYFPESTGAWGDALTHFVLFSAKTGGTVIGYGELKDGENPAPVTVSAERTVVMFRINGLTIKYEDVAE